MKNRANRTLVQALFLTICVGASYALGLWLKDVERGTFLTSTQGLSSLERIRLETNVEMALANAAWTLGDKTAARWFADRELSLAPESQALEDKAVARRRARALIRLAALDTNPEGQSAILSNACALQEDLCQGDNLRANVKAETDRRLVAPGNQPPLFLLGIQHPDGACGF